MSKSQVPDGYLCADNAPPARCAGSAAGLAYLGGGGSTHGPSANGGDHSHGRELRGMAHGNGDSVDLMAGHAHVSSPSMHTAESTSSGAIRLQSHTLSLSTLAHTRMPNCCCSHAHAKLQLPKLLTHAKLLLLCCPHVRAKLHQFSFCCQKVGLVWERPLSLIVAAHSVAAMPHPSTLTLCSPAPPSTQELHLSRHCQICHPSPGTTPALHRAVSLAHQLAMVPLW
jgi:hypothetical protein